LEYYGNNKNETALDIDFCSEDVPSLIRASPFISSGRCRTVARSIVDWHPRQL